MRRVPSILSAPVWRHVSGELGDNTRLRVALGLVVGLLWIYGLLWTSDWIAAQEHQTQDLREQAQRLKPLQRRDLWAVRDQETTDLLTHLRKLLWHGAERGLIEANLQDWLRTVAVKSGLTVRDLRILADVVGEASAATSTLPARLAAESRSGVNVVPLRARLVVEFKRLPAMGLLAELVRNEPLVAVDRLLLRTTSQPPVLEIEMRAMAVTEEGGS